MKKQNLSFDREAINLFFRGIKGKDGFLSNHGLTKEYVERIQDIFAKVYFIRNDPGDRGLEGWFFSRRKRKASYIAQKAKELIGQNSGDQDNISVELVKATDPDTKTKTHNVVVTFNGLSPGPTVDIMAHHDTILPQKHELKLEGETLRGSIIQDDTIHLATLLAALPKLRVPDRGKIRIIFTDHEENGCRGSSALSSRLISRLDKGYPYLAMALESTDRMLACSHRGKFDSWLKSCGDVGEIGQAFMSFYNYLFGVQAKLRTGKKLKDLGMTTGTSTYGIAKSDELRAKLDFRTNSIVDVDVVENIWKARKFDREEVFEHCLQGLKGIDYEIKVGDKTVYLKADETVSHPSMFDLNNDKSVYPPLFLLVTYLVKCGQAKNIKIIEWGNKKRQNSIPNQAKIVFSDRVELTARLLEEEIKHVSLIESPKTSFVLDQVIKKKAVKTKLTDNVVKNILSKLNSQMETEMNLGAVSYMTDIGKVFNQAKESGYQVYGLVWGVGEIKNLHTTNEQITSQDFITLAKFFKIFPNLAIDFLDKESR